MVRAFKPLKMIQDQIPQMKAMTEPDSQQVDLSTSGLKRIHPSRGLFELRQPCVEIVGIDDATVDSIPFL